LRVAIACVILMYSETTQKATLIGGFFVPRGDMIMESYELEPDKIINWAINYASYEELENTAKAVYSIYTMRRKKENPQAHKSAKQARRQFRKGGWQK
jgi:hypothetical protein